MRQADQTHSSYNNDTGCREALRLPNASGYNHHRDMLMMLTAGQGPERELLASLPVNWWTGQAELDPAVLKGHGKRPDDPLLIEHRK